MSRLLSLGVAALLTLQVLTHANFGCVEILFSPCFCKKTSFGSNIYISIFSQPSNDRSTFQKYMSSTRAAVMCLRDGFVFTLQTWAKVKRVVKLMAYGRN